MVRETRHLWVGNLPENIREERIRDHFKRYGRVQSVKLLGRSGGGGGKEDEGGGGACATVSFMDIKSAAKAHHSEQKLDERTLTTEYHEPAAIPCPGTLYSGSGPPNPPGASTGSRFSSHGGSEDLSGSFERSSHFYERSERGETGASGYIRRGGSGSTSGAYHAAESLSRSRARDRLYRNGPYTPLIERDTKQRIGEPRKPSSENDDLVRHNRVVSRTSSSGHHRVSSSGWGYDSPSPRYSASGVPSTPELPYSDDRRETTPVVHKKHSKSGISRRSGSDSPSNSGSSGSRSRSSSASSQSGSSTCSSASSSPASEKSCSTHSQQSSLRSGAQSGVSASHTNSVSPAVHAEDRRPLAICVRNLPARSSDTSLKDGLYHEYKKHGKVTWVKVVGQGVDRYALVCFKKADDVEKALQVSHDKLFFGCKIEVAPYQGYDVDDNEFRPFEAEQDEFHPKATRTLFIGNLEKDITTQEIRKHFDQFGEIIEIDIKKQGNSASYAFCQFSDISSVVRAMRTLDGEHIGANRIKLGFGKSMHTNCVWVDGVSETVSEKYLSTHFGQFGPVTHVVIDRSRGHALVFYEQISYAQQAVKDMRGNSLRGRKLQVDYASRECQEAFYDRIEKQSSTSHTNFDNSITASPQSTSTIVRVYDNGGTATSPAVNSAPTRYPTLTTGGSGVVVTTRFNTTSSSSRTYNRPSASSPTTPSPSPRPSRHGHSSSQRFDYNLDYTNERRSSYRSYEDNPGCDDSGNPSAMGGAGDVRHLQKDRVTLSDQLDECASSGEDTAAGRRRCSKHRRSQSGGEGSRPGTPLCDERPDPPVEPRRAPRDRPPDPLSLPLPRFAAQVLSPRPVLPSPPASPQTPHSSSSDSEPSPPSPEWEERLRSLDEKYEKWSGSRSGVTKVDPTSLKFKHKFELDLNELQPSEIVKSVLAKRSVFDEDSKRLENFGEKYEPREFVPANRANVLRRLDMSPLSSPVNKSPGLQYPFPSHPPVQPLGSSGLASTSTIPALTVASEAKPNNTFLTNCTRQFTPKISSPSSSVETSPKPSTQPPADKFKTKCTPSPMPIPPPAPKKELVTTPPPKPKPCSIRRDSTEEKSELRRKSRDDVCPESVAKKDDISESDKVKDAQISERRKSSVDKRRNSVDIKDLIISKPLENSCDRPKDISDKQEERRRGSSEADVAPTVPTDPRIKPCDFKKQEEPNQSYDNTRTSETEKKRLTTSDSVERRKEVETLHRHNSTEIQDKKKDVLGVNSEKDRRRARESVDSSNDNPKHNRKVPENKKEECVTEKKEEEIKPVEHPEKKNKEVHDASSRSREKRESVDREREKRRDSREEAVEKNKSEKVSSEPLDRFKDHKKPETTEPVKKKEFSHNDPDNKLMRKDSEEAVITTAPRNSKKDGDHDSEANKKDSKHKEERKKNSENEISKEHSLFKKVFGFADSIRHHKGGVDKRDNDTSTAVKMDTPEPNKHRDKKKDKEEHSDKHKSCNRKSPDQPDNNRHKEEKRRHSESKKRDFETEDVKKEENHVQPEVKPHTKSSKKEDPSYKDSNHRNAYYEHNSSEHSKYNRDSERRKDSISEETRKPENDLNCLENNKKEEEEFYERRKEDGFRSKENDRRKGSFDSSYDNNFDNSAFVKAEKKNDIVESSKYAKHERHRERDKSKDHDTVQNCRTKEERKNDTLDKHKSDKKKDCDGHRIKEEKKNIEESCPVQKDNDKKKDEFDAVKMKDDAYAAYRESIRKKEVAEAQERLKEIERKKEEKERRKERELMREKDNNDKVKSKHSRDFEATEPKVNGDHDIDYTLDATECRKTVITYDDSEHQSAKKEKKREKNSWPATIGCKRRLSSQDSIEINDDAKRIKPERRDSKDSGRSSGSSRKGSGEKHKGYKLLEEKIKEDKEKEQRKNSEETNHEAPAQFEEKPIKPASRKEKRNSGEKRKEKFKSRPRENGTASESDLASGDEEQQSKANKQRQQHSIFDIVDDEPAYISMYDKVKARSTKNMQKLEEEKRQEKLKEKFHALKQSRAKREEKKRSTSYDEDSDSEKGSMRRSSKLLLTSSEDDATSEPDVRVRKNKILYDTSEDDSVVTTGKTRKGSFHDDNKSSRKIISDISEDDTTAAPIKHSTPKVKVNRNITFDTEPKSRKIVSDTSEDDSSRLNSTPRILKPSRIHSDDSEGDLGFEDSIRNETKPLQNISDMFQSRPVEVNHFTNSIHDEAAQQPLQSSPESFRRNSLDSTTSEQHRKKSHKKKQKRQKNLEENEDGTIKKHSSKKDKKRAHRDKDDEEKRRKRVEKESINNKRDDKLEDIFGPLSDDSVKNMGNKWNVAQVYGSDSESERENIRKKEKKRREKKMRELDEAGRAIEAKLLDSCDNINLDEPVKTKKKKRKKSRDEKNKHHQREDEAPVPILPKEETKVDPEEEKEIPLIEIKEEAVDEPEETDKDGYEADVKKETKMEEEMDSAPDLRQHSMSSLLDSPPPSQPSNICKKPGIPGFSSEIDENIHETAVKSISESPCTTLDESDLKFEDKSKTEEPTVQPEDGNPKTIISQEETEDAVAALLMEDAFGGGFEGYNEDTPKPDTPVSEPDLQIDTDTEDNYDPIDFSRPPRTPDIPSNFYRQNESREGLEERIMMSLACSSDSSLKESPRPLQMPPTPDHKPDKKDASDSDSFEPEKTQDKQSAVKQLVELTEEEPEESTQEKKAPPAETERCKEEVPKTEQARAESPKKVEDVIKEPKRPGSPPPPLSDSVVKPAPPLDMPKLIMISQKVPAITINVAQSEVPSLVPLSNKSDFPKLERVHHIPSQLKPVITSSESSVVQSNPAHVVNLLSPTPKNHFRESMPPLSQGWSGKADMAKSMPMLATVTTDLPRSQPPPLHPTHPPASAAPIESAHTKSLPQVSPPVSQHHPPPLSQPPPLILTSISKPPPLQPTLSKPPPLVHTSHAPMQVVSPAPLLTPRTDAAPQPTSTIQSTNQQVFAKTGHRLPINPLPPLKPVVNTLPASLHSSKTNTTVTLSTPNQNPATTQVRTIHPLASLTLVPTVKDPKAPAPSPTGQIIQAKQLHVITSTSQLSPTPPISPQNLKLVRPSIPVTAHLQLPPLQNINIQPLKTPVISQHSPNRSHPPLLQTVNIDEHIKASSQIAPKALIPTTPNPQLLMTPIQAPHPEKVITLSPSQPPSLKPSLPVNVIKTSESAPKEHHPEIIPAEKEAKTVTNVEVEVPTTRGAEITKFVPTAPLSAVSPTEKPQQPKDELEKRTPEPLPIPKLEPKPPNKPDQEETKPLNAVIQDLTLRAANKQQQPQPNWKTRTNITAEPPKTEVSRPIEQLVRELARKRQASESKEPEKPAPPDDEPKSDTETLKTDERLSDSEPLEPISSKDDAKVELKVEPVDEPKQEPVGKEDVVKVEDVKAESPKRPLTPPAEEKPERPPSPLPEKPPQQLKAPETKPEEDVKAAKSAPEKERQSVEKEVAPKADLMVSTPPSRGGRGGRKRKATGGRGGITTRRTRANNAPTTPASTDVYEFRDDSEEETGRPRLIMTIKSPPEPSATPKVHVPPPAVAQPSSPPPTKEKESGGGATTRKSRRLQEKDGGTKSSSDEIIEEIITTRGRPSRRATRSTVQTLIPPVETTRKSPRRKQTSSSSSTLQVPAHNTRQRSASPAPPPLATSPAAAPSPSPTPSTPHAPSAAPRRSPTPQRPPSPAKAPAPTPVVGSPAPSTPQPPPTPPQLSPQASTPVPQPQPVPTTQPQLPPPPDAAAVTPVVTLAPTSVGQPTPPPTPSTPSSQPLTLVPSTTATITSTQNPVSTVPAVAHAVSIPAATAAPSVALPATPIAIVLPAAAPPVILPATVTPVALSASAMPVVAAHPQSLPVPLTTIHGPPQVQPTPGQPPPAHSGPAHSVASVHGHRPPSAHSGQQSSAIKYRCKTSAGEPTKLIDPVTGLLIPMTESEEGQYIPVGDMHRTAGGNVAAHLNKEPSEGEPPEKRARLLNLVGKEEAVARTPLPRPSVVRPTASQPSPSPPTATPPAAHSQPVKIMVPSSHPIEAHLGRGHQIPPPLMGGAPPKAPMSGVVPMTPKSHLLQAVTPSRMRPQAPPPAQHSKGPMAPKAHILQAMGNAQAREGVVGSPAPHQGALLTGSVASPPLRAHQQPIVTGASSARVLVKGDVPGSRGDVPVTRVGDGKHIVVPSPSSQGPPSRSQVVQPGIPLSAYEASLGEQLQHVSSYPPHHHYVHPPFVFQPPYLREAAGIPGPYHRSAAPKGGVVKGADMDDRPAPPSAASASAMIASPPLELRRGSPHDRTTDSPQVVPVYMHRTGQQFYYEGPPHPPPPAHRPHNPPNTGRLQTPPHASQVPPQADSLLMLLQRYPVMWQGLLALKNDQAAVQMHFVFGNPVVARESLPCNSDGSTPPLRIAQRMRLEQTQVEGVARKMQMDNEHCMLLALPCGRDHMDVLQQSNNLQNGFITYLQQKQAAGIVNIAAPGSPQPAYVVHIFPSCDFANESLARIAPDLLHRVADLAHLLIVIATV